jgi:hypothetical protein
VNNGSKDRKKKLNSGKKTNNMSNKRVYAKKFKNKFNKSGKKTRKRTKASRLKEQ